MELRLLTGSYTETSSSKAAEDDQLEEVLEKYGSMSHSEKDRKILTKENAQEAAVELMEQKTGLETIDAMDSVKGIFAEVWKTHDVNNKGNIDFNEGFTLMQDVMTHQAEVKK